MLDHGASAQERACYPTTESAQDLHSLPTLESLCTTDCACPNPARASARRACYASDASTGRSRNTLQDFASANRHACKSSQPHTRESYHQIGRLPPCTTSFVEPRHARRTLAGERNTSRLQTTTFQESAEHRAESPQAFQRYNCQSHGSLTNHSSKSRPALTKWREPMPTKNPPSRRTVRAVRSCTCPSLVAPSSMRCDLARARSQRQHTNAS